MLQIVVVVVVVVVAVVVVVHEGAIGAHFDELQHVATSKLRTFGYF